MLHFELHMQSLTCDILATLSRLNLKYKVKSRVKSRVKPGVNFRVRPGVKAGVKSIVRAEVSLPMKGEVNRLPMPSPIHMQTLQVAPSRNSAKSRVQLH